MDTKFTPGPWHVVNGKNLTWYAISADPNDAYINIASVTRYSEPEKAEAHKANATLIAAAPDMYEALVGLLDDKDTTYGVRVTRARAALAKVQP